MSVLYDLAISLLWLPYIYGGKNPLVGLDCSGLVTILLKSAGIAPPVQTNAQGLYDFYYSNSANNVYQIGALAFFGESVTKISHVGWLLNPSQMIEAGHGTSEIDTLEEAIQRGSYVRISLVNQRKDLVAVLRPSYAKIGVP